MPTTGNNVQSIYYAKDRWPIYDFANNPPKPARYQIVRKSQLRTEDKNRLKESVVTQL